MGYLAPSDVLSIHLQSGQMLLQQKRVMLPLRAVDLLAEEVPADSSFAFVDEVEIDQRVEFAHSVETIVAAASADVVAFVAVAACGTADIWRYLRWMKLGYFTYVGTDTRFSGSIIFAQEKDLRL